MLPVSQVVLADSYRRKGQRRSCGSQAIQRRHFLDDEWADIKGHSRNILEYNGIGQKQEREGGDS